MALKCKTSTKTAAAAVAGAATETNSDVEKNVSWFDDMNNVVNTYRIYRVYELFAVPAHRCVLMFCTVDQRNKTEMVKRNEKLLETKSVWIAATVLLLLLRCALIHSFSLIRGRILVLLLVSNERVFGCEYAPCSHIHRLFQLFALMWMFHFFSCNF